jgi:hypothetical protein
MRKIFRLFLVALIVGILIVPTFFPVSISGADATLKEYLNTGGDANSSAIWGLDIVAQQFTSNSTAHTVTKIKVYLQRNAGGSPGTVTLGLYNASAGTPTGDYLAYGTINGNSLPTSYVLATFTMNVEVALNSATQYAIVVSAENGTGANYVNWWQDSGGGLANAVASHSTNAGATWTSDTPADCLFEVWGNTVLAISSVKVFLNYIPENAASVGGTTYYDWLICAEVVNDYPPYAQNKSNPSQYFAVQLLDPTGTTIIASVPMVSFGDFPESIYLTGNSTTSLTVSGAYIFRVIGTFPLPPSVSYTIQSGDWQGNLVSNKYAHFNDWVIGTAQNMETYYGLSGSSALATLITGLGWSLTSSGGAYFTIAIPGIMDKDPNLFQYAKTKPQFEIGTDATIYYSEIDFENKVGIQITNICTTFGTLFGLSGKDFAGYVLSAIIAIIVVIGLFAGESAGALAIMVVGGIPLLLLGNYINAIGIQWTLVFSGLMLFLFARQFYLKVQ